MEEPRAKTDGDKAELVKYGELVVLGYNGSLPQGDRGRRRSKFVLYRRSKANGIARSRHYKMSSSSRSEALNNSQIHSISYTLNRNHVVIVEYAHDEQTDLFQIGRSSEAPIDFVVMDTQPNNENNNNNTKNVSNSGMQQQSTISRFACRILADRDDLSCRIFAAGFDSSRNIFLGEKATKWEAHSHVHEVDGLTTNGVLISKPDGKFCDDTNAQPGIWREISVGGKTFGLRASRSASTRGQPVDNEDNEMVDGTLIDLCGATLLWRSAKGLSESPTPRQLERCLAQLNAGRPQCPVGLHTLIVPTRNSKLRPEALPVVYLNCGHVQGRHEWGNMDDRKGSKTCPICLGVTEVSNLVMGSEPAFYVDCSVPDFCFVPCGHMASERTVKYWASVPIPCGTAGFQAACPFCAVPLEGTPGYVRLIFQDKCDF